MHPQIVHLRALTSMCVNLHQALKCIQTLLSVSSTAAQVSKRRTCCAGHSLGGFTAASCAILNTRIHHCTTFEAPGLTTFYHKLAEQSGDAEFWDTKITNYVTIPNPINMCQKHLGEVYRVYTRTECKTDMLHVFKCLFGSCVRTLNWLLLANVLVTAGRVLAGGVTNFLACADVLSSERSWATFKVTHPSHRLLDSCSVYPADAVTPLHLAGSCSCHSTVVYSRLVEASATRVVLRPHPTEQDYGGCTGFIQLRVWSSGLPSLWSCSVCLVYADVCRNFCTGLIGRRICPGFRNGSMIESNLLFVVMFASEVKNCCERQSHLNPDLRLGL